LSILVTSAVGLLTRPVEPDIDHRAGVRVVFPLGAGGGCLHHEHGR
jgi:hypothetical protein